MGQEGGNLGKAAEEMAFKWRPKDSGPLVQRPGEELPGRGDSECPEGK